MDYDRKRVSMFDSTLRDGAQAEGISFSVLDKLKFVVRWTTSHRCFEAGNPVPIRRTWSSSRRLRILSSRT